MLALSSRPTPRQCIFVTIALLAAVSLLIGWSPLRERSNLSKIKGVGVSAALKRAEVVRERCRKNAGLYEKEYGRANLRLARSYEGSGARLKQVMQRALRGEDIVIGVLGGSVTRGHGVFSTEIWANLFTDWFKEFIPKGGEVIGVNGAVPATGSDYFSFCFSSHIPLNSNIILIELAINDEPLDEHTENMENLLRSLLDLPSRPAIIMVEALGLGGGSMRYGGDVHLPVAIYYDVPVISMRNPLAPHLMRHDELVRPYFTNNFWNDPDVRHVNSRGHRDMSRMVESLVMDMTCELVEDMLPSSSPSDGKSQSSTSGDESLDFVDTDGNEWQSMRPTPDQVQEWGPWKHVKEEGDPHMMLGCWPPEDEMGLLPRIRFNQRWSEDTTNLPLEPQCLSTRSEAQHLIPERADGWYEWFHPDFPEKTYLFSNTTGSVFTVDIETRLGLIKMYSLRSKTFGLGSVWCWVGDDYDRGVRADGYWENGDANIGRFTTISSNLPPGRHTVSCELLEETADPGGGREFRIISMMSM